MNFNSLYARRSTKLSLLPLNINSSSDLASKRNELMPARAGEAVVDLHRVIQRIRNQSFHQRRPRTHQRDRVNFFNDVEVQEGDWEPPGEIADRVKSIILQLVLKVAIFEPSIVTGE